MSFTAKIAQSVGCSCIIFSSLVLISTYRLASVSHRFFFFFNWIGIKHDCLCIDRDSARWNMDPITIQKRRNLFWEVFSADVSHVSPEREMFELCC